MNSKTILLVEDDLPTARVYQSLFERQGYTVNVLPDGSDAFMEAHNRHYDILLLDLMLPNMDGLAMLRRFRAQKRFGHVPIFLYTVAEVSQVEPMALEAGATKVFSKTRPAKEIVEAILNTVSSPHQPRATSAEGSAETEVHQGPDFRVPARDDSPKLTLKMANAEKEAEPPVSAKMNLKEDKNDPKKGLMSRLFGSKSKDK